MWTLVNDLIACCLVFFMEMMLKRTQVSSIEQRNRRERKKRRILLLFFSHRHMKWSFQCHWQCCFNLGTIFFHHSMCTKCMQNSECKRIRNVTVEKVEVCTSVVTWTAQHNDNNLAEQKRFDEGTQLLCKTIELSAFFFSFSLCLNP